MTQTLSPRATNAESMLVSAAGEALCLGFANTLAWRGRAETIESLEDFASLLAWAERHVGLPAPVARRLEEWSRGQPSRSEQALAEAKIVREAIYRMASALAGGTSLNDPDFAVLSAALAHAPTRQRLARSGGGFAWRIELESGSGGLPVPVLLAPVLWSAADLMVGGARPRIRQCANEQCLWLFVDASKSGTRRWCDMASCGNRAKARRHYLKTKQG